MTGSRVFLLSPARTDGKRAEMLFNGRAQFELAKQLRTPQGADLGEVFAFLSGLYFRAKLKYATAFGARVGDVVAMFVITPDRGLVPPWTRVTLEDLREMAAVPVDAADPRYRGPLDRDAVRLLKVLPPEGQVVLLGSVATSKYLEPLSAVFGHRLLFPADFVGRGELSRGGLLLDRVRAGEELPYISAAGAARHGPRPAPRRERRERKLTVRSR
jgi:hypothetical protein